MKFLPLLAAVLVAPVLFAQSTPNPAATPSPAVAMPMWRATLPGGTYEVALRSIVSVSSHEYLVDGAARVTEVNIDTTGAGFVRFYYIEPNTPTTMPLGIGQATADKATELFQQGQARAGQAGDAWQKVIKNYPTTTHQRTIEYRFGDKDTLMKLFDSAESAFRLNKNTVFSAQ